MQFSSSPIVLIIALLTVTAVAYQFGRSRAMSIGRSTDRGIRGLHSLPRYHGFSTALLCMIPALLLLGIWFALQGKVITGLVVAQLPEAVQALPDNQLGLVLNDVRNIVSGNIVSSNPDAETLAAAEHYRSLTQTTNIARNIAVLCLAFVGLFIGWRLISVRFRARNFVERIVLGLLMISSGIAILTTVGIVLSVLFESIRFFQSVSVTEFLFGTRWSPQTALRSDQVGASGAFGAVPLFAGTLLISFIAMVVAVPTGLMSAIYLSEYASERVRAVVKPTLEILAGIPTVVYGFFAALVIAPSLRNIGESIGLSVASESALAAGLVMGIMIIPFVSSLSDDVINAVPQSLRDGSYGLGATQSETIRQVIIPAALPGIAGGILLAVSRAIGETMIVVMAAGLSPNLTANPFEAVTTVTVQIVTLLVGDQEFDSPKTLAAFALGLVLFVATLILNVIALYIVRKYREQYD